MGLASKISLEVYKQPDRSIYRGSNYSEPYGLDLRVQQDIRTYLSLKSESD